jgi:hypothetical protein
MDFCGGLIVAFMAMLIFVSVIDEISIRVRGLDIWGDDPDAPFVSDMTDGEYD